MSSKIGSGKIHEIRGTIKVGKTKWILGNIPVGSILTANKANANVWDAEAMSSLWSNRVNTKTFYYNCTPASDLAKQGDLIIGTKSPSRFNQRSMAVCYDNLDNYAPDLNPAEENNRIREWLNDEDPQTQPATLDSEDVQVQKLIYRFRKLLNIPYHQRLADRLLSLFNNAKEEDPNSLGIKAGSLRDFYDFLRLHNNLKYPSIFLTPDENIYATWKSNQNRVFSVNFLSNKDVRFVIFKPNKNNLERIFRSSGTATTDTLMDEILSDSLDWTRE